ncbi:MAG: hemin uptake protein HemP [Rhodoferax sp.]|nr:hemin uptake protein HemP [Rhodoferax sp.]
MTTSLVPVCPNRDSHSGGPWDAQVLRRGVVRVTSQKLLGTFRELEIEHGTERYRLRVTSTGKLILTK